MCMCLLHFCDIKFNLLVFTSQLRWRQLVFQTLAPRGESRPHPFPGSTRWQTHGGSHTMSHLCHLHEKLCVYIVSMCVVDIISVVTISTVRLLVIKQVALLKIISCYRISQPSCSAPVVHTLQVLSSPEKQSVVEKKVKSLKYTRLIYFMFWLTAFERCLKGPMWISSS